VFYFSYVDSGVISIRLLVDLYFAAMVELAGDEYVSLVGLFLTLPN